MTIKEQVLSSLIKAQGKSVSGEALANELFCSRNAVWKAIKSLRSDGYRIDAVTNKGYCLAEENEIFSKISIEKYLKTDCDIILLDETESTNNYLKAKAESGAKENTVVIAKNQTKGKGRLGREFFSHESGVYMSILLKPKFAASKSLFITTAAAVAVSQAIEEISGRKAGIKWVNDIFIDNRKVCGILTEGSIDFETGGLHYAVLGIGVNVYYPNNDFPEELREIAGAVYKTKPKDKEIKQKLIAKIIDNFFEIYNNFESSGFMQEYKQKSIVLGKEIFVLKGEKRKKAKAIDIDDNACLIVKYENGETEVLSSGEVSVRL